MKKLYMSDMTLARSSQNLTFREKLDLAGLLDRLEVSAIELGRMTNPKADSLFVKSVASSVKTSSLSVSCLPDVESVDLAWNALKSACKPRIQIYAPVSPARMEYVLHKKSDSLIEDIRTSVSHASSLCEDVEFFADDATRADWSFLCRIIDCAIECGAKTVTLCESAGNMLEWEFSAFLEKLKAELPSLAKARLGVFCSDELHLATSCTVGAIKAGADEVKLCMRHGICAETESLCSILSAKGDSLGVSAGIRTAEINRVLGLASGLFDRAKMPNSPFQDGVGKAREEVLLTSEATVEEISKQVTLLGYEISESDLMKVYNAFVTVAAKKQSVGLRELEIIIASQAMQVPAAYTLAKYVVTTGNGIDVVAHVKLVKDNEVLDGLSLGDGPIDAAFLAIEKITGCHYELDDFQLQAITEGREAMGQTFVKLRAGGKVYSGRGISTDIVGSGIQAYLNALNKIVYEEGL